MQKQRAAGRLVRAAVAGMTLALAGPACSGAIDPAGGGRPGSQPGPGPGGMEPVRPPDDPGVTMPPLPPAAQAMFKPGPATLRRLTGPQYTNAIRDLLGDDVTVPGDFEPDTVLSGFASIGASLTTVSADGDREVRGRGDEPSPTQALADPARRARLVTCTPAAPADEACARRFVTGFGRRAWRRPLAADEVTRYAAIATRGRLDARRLLEGAGLRAGRPAPVAATSSTGSRSASPGAAPASASSTAGSWPRGCRSSSSNSTPDDALLDAAQSGALARRGRAAPAGRAPARLAARPRASCATSSTSCCASTASTTSSRARPTSRKATKTLGPAMREETLRLLEEVVLAGGGDYRRAFDADFTFVNRELAPALRPARARGRRLRAGDPAGRRPAPGPARARLVPGQQRPRGDHLAHPPRQVRARGDALPRDPRAAARRRRQPAARGQAGRGAAHHARAAGGPQRPRLHRLPQPHGSHWAWPSRTSTPSAPSGPTDAGQPIDASGDLDGQRFRQPARAGRPAARSTPTSSPAWCAASTATPSATSRARARRC